MRGSDATPALFAASGPAALAAALERRAVVRAPEHAPPCRLALLDPTAARLEQARRIVAAGKPWRGAADIWFTPAPLLHPGAGDRVGFLFPGLDATAPPSTADAASWLGLPPVRLLGDGTVGGLTSDVLRTGWLADALLRRVGVRPGATAGHSSGEWIALFAAGVWPAESFDDFATWMGPGAFTMPDVVFAAVGAGADVARELADGVPGVVVSHDNSPRQTVLCGAEDQVRRCLDRIGDPAVRRKVLPFRSGFHSPALRPHLPPIEAIFDRLPLRDREIPVWSATTAAPYPEDETAIRELLTRHLLEPVRFREVVLRLYDHGIRAFVQVGSGSLDRFVADTLGDRPHLTVTSVAAGRPSLVQLRCAAAALWVDGLRPDLAVLGIGRAPAPVLAEFRTTMAALDRSLRQVVDAWEGR